MPPRLSIGRPQKLQTFSTLARHISCLAFYSRTMAWPPLVRTPTSAAVWIRAQIPQNHKQRKSLQQEPSIPFDSLTFSLIFSQLMILPMGHIIQNPHLQQSSPTFSAVSPKTMHGQKYDQIQSPQLSKQPKRPYDHSPMLMDLFFPSKQLKLVEYQKDFIPFLRLRHLS